MNLDQQFEQWEEELTFRERAEFAMEFIESVTQAYGITIDMGHGREIKDTALIHYDLQTEFRNWLYEFYVNMEDRGEEMSDEDDERVWSNHNVDDDFHRFG